MKEKLRDHYRLLKSAAPGERFQNYYWHKKESHPVKMFIKFICGALCCLLAVVLIFTPGPAFVFWIIGFALFSSQSLLIAKLLDRLELNVRRMIRRK